MVAASFSIGTYFSYFRLISDLIFLSEVLCQVQDPNYISSFLSLASFCPSASLHKMCGNEVGLAAISVFFSLIIVILMFCYLYLLRGNAGYQVNR